MLVTAVLAGSNGAVQSNSSSVSITTIRVGGQDAGGVSSFCIGGDATLMSASAMPELGSHSNLHFLQCRRAASEGSGGWDAPGDAKARAGYRLCRRADMLSALKGRGSKGRHYAALRMLPASTGRFRCPSTGFKDLSSPRFRITIAALVSALASWLQPVQTNRA